MFVVTPRKMREREVCFAIIVLLSIATFISIVHSSKLKAIRLMKHAVKGLKKFKKLTPILLLVRKKPVVIVVKKNCNHALFPELGLGGDAFAASHWLPEPETHAFPYSEYVH